MYYTIQDKLTKGETMAEKYQGKQTAELAEVWQVRQRLVVGGRDKVGASDSPAIPPISNDI